MNIREQEFQDAIKEIIDLIKSQPPAIQAVTLQPAWNMGQSLPTGPIFKKLLEHAIADPQLRRIYKTDDAIVATVYRFLDRYFINQSFGKKLKYSKREAKKIYSRWIKEVMSDQTEIIILASVLNFEVNRAIKIREFEFFPIPKSGTILDLEKKIYVLLGYKNVKDIRRVDEYSQYHHSYFFGGNALRIKDSFPKRAEFYQYPSFPENGYQDLQKRISDFVTVLRLFKAGDFVIGSYHHGVLSPFTPGAVHFGDKKYNNGLQYPLVDKKEILRLRNFVNKLLPIIEMLNQLPLPIQIGVEYLNSSYEKGKIHEKFIDLMIALDALLGTQAETTFRLALRAARFLSKKKIVKEEIYKKILEAAKLRGNLVHGNQHPSRINQGEIEQNRSYIEKLVRNLIVKLLMLYNQGRINNQYKDKFDINFTL